MSNKKIEEYHVMWRIELDATSEKEAAQLALDIILSNNIRIHETDKIKNRGNLEIILYHGGRIFEVNKTKGKNKVVLIDLGGD